LPMPIRTSAQRHQGLDQDRRLHGSMCNEPETGHSAAAGASAYSGAEPSNPAYRARHSRISLRRTQPEQVGNREVDPVRRYEPAAGKERSVSCDFLCAHASTCPPRQNHASRNLEEPQPQVRGELAHEKSKTRRRWRGVSRRREHWVVAWPTRCWRGTRLLTALATRVVGVAHGVRVVAHALLSVAPHHSRPWHTGCGVATSSNLVCGV